MSNFIPQKQDQIKSLTKSLRPKKPTVGRLSLVPSMIYIQNSQLLKTPTDNNGLFQNYTILSNINSGAQGTTYLAHTQDNRKVVIKRIISRIDKQIKTICNTVNLITPTIPLLLELFTEENALFMVQEAGTIDLEEFLSVYHILPNEIFWTIAQDISKAIEISHINNIAHLDIKPANILINSLSQTPQQSSQRNENVTPENINYSYIAINSLSQKPSHTPNTALNRQNQLIFDENPLENLISDVMLSPEPIQRITFDAPPVQHFNDPLTKINCSDFSDLKNHCIFQLIDFGISQKFPFQQDLICGDSRYLKQSFLTSGNPSFSCDNFSFGVVLFEVFSGCDMPSYGENYEKLRAERGICEVFGWGKGDGLILGCIEDLLYDEEMTISQWRAKYCSNFPDRSSVYHKLSVLRSRNKIIIVAGLSKAKYYIKRRNLTLKLFIKFGGLLRFKHRKKSPEQILVTKLQINLNTTQIYQNFTQKESSEDNYSFFHSKQLVNQQHNLHCSTSEITLQNQQIDPNCCKSTTNFEENSNALNLTKISETSSSFCSNSSNSSFSIVKQTKQSQTVQTLLSALETITGIASMVYYQPLNFYHPTPTTVVQNSVQFSYSPPGSFKGDFPLVSTPIVEDSMLNHRIKGILRPKSGNYQILNQEELMQNGYRSLTDAFVDCFENKPQNVKMCGFLSKNRCFLFVIFNFIGSFVIKEKVARVVISLIYVILIQRINKYNISLMQERQYYYIKNSNVFYDPIKLRSGIFGFLCPMLFIFLNQLAEMEIQFVILICCLESTFIWMCGGFQ